MKLFTLSFLLSILFSSVASCDAENVEYSRLFVCTDSLKEPYGLCTHLSRKGVKYEFNTRSHEINMIGSVGANWIRTDFDRGRFINKHKLLSASSVSSALKGLLDKDFITMDKNVYSVYDQFFSLWLAFKGMI